MKTILFTLCLSLVATAALAGYCTDERWEAARRQKETFIDNYTWTRNEYSGPSRHFRRGAVLLFQYGGGNLDEKSVIRIPLAAKNI